MLKPRQRITVVGAGTIAGEYIKILTLCGFEYEDIIVIGNTKKNTIKFCKERGLKNYIYGGIDQIKDDIDPQIAVVAVPITHLASVTMNLIKKGYKYLLIEKPGGFGSRQLSLVAENADRYEASVFVAYNRRFYPSVLNSQEIIKNDGGLIYCNFDFTEIEKFVLDGQNTEETLNRWGLANSLHVIDLALFFMGRPKHSHFHRNGSLPWHPQGEAFTGSGVAGKNILFNYQGIWSGAGRWALTLVTREHKLSLCPLEKLYIQKRNEFTFKEIPLSKETDGLKSGFLGQVKAFLSWSTGERYENNLCTISEAAEHMRFAEKIFCYKPL